MESPIAAIGFSKVTERHGLDKILTEILDKPTEQKASRTTDKDIVGEYLKEFGSDMYMMARVVLKEGDETSKLHIKQCEPYVKSKYTIKVEELSVECIDEEYDYYAICEEVDTGMQFIFWLQNVVEYMDAMDTLENINEVQIAALGMEGTIVLPIEEDEEDESEILEKANLRQLLELARQGDEEARTKLEEQEKELDQQLKERLNEEDFLSIMSGYFVPTTLIDATYAILGQIKSIETRVNTQTSEESYLFTLDVNDVPLEVLINKNNLVGYPTVGMRFMGTCWLQGTVVIDK